jgi:hypothetical protein
MTTPAKSARNLMIAVANYLERSDEDGEFGRLHMLLDEAIGGNITGVDHRHAVADEFRKAAEKVEIQ